MEDDAGAITPVACAFDVATGDLIWRITLQANPSPWGMAVDRDGRVLVTLSNGISREGCCAVSEWAVIG